MKVRIQNILSAVVIALFMLGQIFLLSELWKINSDKLELSYGMLAREAVNDLYYSNNVLDSVYSNFNKIAIENIIVYNTVKNQSKEMLDKITFDKFEKELLKNENISLAIKHKLEENNVNTCFRKFLIFRSIELLPASEQVIEIYNEKSNDYLIKPQRAIKISSFIKETPLFRTKFEFYIDLTDKEKLVLKNSFLLILIGFLCLVIVFTVYFSSLKNMRKERKLSEMKTDFLHNLMHELRTPLATLSLAGKTLEMEEVLNDKSKIISTSDTIKRQNMYLSQLIDHIIDISIWEKEQFRLDLVKYDITKLVQEIITAFKDGTKSDVTIVEEYDTNMPSVLVDIFHFKTMLNNLLSNAVKYCSKSPVITVKVKFKDVFFISVEDNGIGISQEDQKYLFDKFYRAKQNDKQLVKGLGLGLYYVKKIVEAHGGQINLKSKINRGSTFTIILKLNNNKA